VDARNRVRYPTIAKRAIAVKATADSLSEELRVLYVALSLARDRLIMTYASQTLEKDLQELALRMDVSKPELMTQDVVCPGQWVLMTALQRTEAGELFALGGKPKETTPGDPTWLIRVAAADASDAVGKESEPDVPSAPEDFVRMLQESLAFSYPYKAATLAPSKQTATQRKGRDKDTEAAEYAQEPKAFKRNWRSASSLRMAPAGKDVGNAMHAVMQYLRFDACTDEQGVRQEVNRLTMEGYLTPEQAQLVDCGKIAAFFTTELGQKLRTGNSVLREFKFSILDDGCNFAAELTEEKILLQGVVDCALIEEDGITVIDFKTDYVTEETVAQRADYYRLQVKTYADALQRIYQKKVKGALLYFFHLSRFVSVV
jgi:ATP-dependent helicase/nuclease subunit A